MIDLKVWRPLRRRDLSQCACKAIIRSSIFLKEKMKPNEDFDKLKARLFDEGNVQDKILYETMTSPTASTPGVAAADGRLGSHYGHHCCIPDGSVERSTGPHADDDRQRQRLVRATSWV